MLLSARKFYCGLNIWLKSQLNKQFSTKKYGRKQDSIGAISKSLTIALLVDDVSLESFPSGESSEE